MALIEISVAVLHALLQHHGAAHRIDDRGELDEEAIAGGLNNAALVLGNQRIDKLLAMSLERDERPFLIGAHEARIPRHARGKDGSEPQRGAGLSGVRAFLAPAC